MKVPTFVTLPASVFLGGVVGALSADPANAFLSVGTAKPALFGALLVGLVAVVHLYQPQPVAAPPPAGKS